MVAHAKPGMDECNIGEKRKVSPEYLSGMRLASSEEQRLL